LVEPLFWPVARQKTIEKFGTASWPITTRASAWERIGIIETLVLKITGCLVKRNYRLLDMCLKFREEFWYESLMLLDQD